MTVINLQLSESLETFVATQAAAEGHSSATDYILSLLQQAQQTRKRSELEASLLEGLHALEHGEGREMTAADWERLRNGVVEKYGEAQKS